MKRLFLTVLILSIIGKLAVAASIHYFDLKNRPAEEVIPLIKPFLEANEAISGDGYQLFIKTNAQRKQEIENLITSIDKAIKTFRITVTNDEFVTSKENNINANVTARSGDAEISVGSNPREEPGISINVDTRKVEDKSDRTQFVQVQEGKPAFISRERLHIIPIYSYVQRANGNFVIEHNQLSPSKQDGFYVVARSIDESSVQISIQSSSSHRQTYQGYGQDQTYVDTTLQVPLGEWFEIGGNTDTRTNDSSGILYRTKKNQQRENKIFLKIETQ